MMTVSSDPDIRTVRTYTYKLWCIYNVFTKRRGRMLLLLV